MKRTQTYFILFPTITEATKTLKANFTVSGISSFFSELNRMTINGLIFHRIPRRIRLSKLPVS